VAARRKGKRPPRAALARRWLVLVVLGVVAYLYYHPLVAYLEARGEAAKQAAEVRALAREQQNLERRLAAQTSNRVLLAEARRLGFVQPGERLFIVKGIPEWRRARRATLKDDG
jgi:hypothetical protein